MTVLKIAADSDLHKVLKQYELKGQSIQGLMPAIGDMLAAAVSDVFEAEGPGWEPLAEATIRARRNRDSTSIKILQDTGILAGSIEPVIGADYVEAVAGASYGIFHTSKEPRTVIPLRDFTDLGPFEEPLLEDVASMLLEQLG